MNVLNSNAGGRRLRRYRRNPLSADTADNKTARRPFRTVYGFTIAVLSLIAVVSTIAVNWHTILSWVEKNDVTATAKVVERTTETLDRAKSSYRDPIAAAGRSNMAFRNDSGEIAIATATGLVSLGNPGPSWRRVGLGDFSGDGGSRILWQNDDGEVAIWN
jgi:hypothetical protein